MAPGSNSVLSGVFIWKDMPCERWCDDAIHLVAGADGSRAECPGHQLLVTGPESHDARQGKYGSMLQEQFAANILRMEVSH